MSRRCTTKPGSSARDLFKRDLFIGGTIEKDSARWKIRERFSYFGRI